MRSSTLLAAGLTALICLTCVVRADDYPSRPIKLTIPYAANGTANTAGRLAAMALEPKLGQTVIVENKPGAGGRTATEAVAQGTHDGYEVVMTSPANLIIIPKMVGADLRYNPEKDFVPLGQIWAAAQALIVNPKSEFGSLSGFVKAAKEKPGQIAYGTAGIGTTTHLTMAALAQAASIDLIHVPYRAIGPALTDLVAGQISGLFTDIASVAPLIQAGRLQALAVTGHSRSTLLPDVPTTLELGFGSVKTINWYGIHAPARTPPPVLAKLRTAMRAAQLDPEYQAKLKGYSTSTDTVGAENFAKMIEQERAYWEQLVQLTGLLK